MSSSSPPADLFAAAAEDRLTRQAPLAARMRPATLDDVVGQEHLLGRGRPLRTLIEADRLSSVILWGPPGTGKTTLAQLIAHTTAKAYVQLSAVTATVKDVREVAQGARDRLGQRDQGTILFLDEVHRFNKAQQDALLPSVESGLLVLIGATTENPYFEVNPPLLSRSTLFRLDPLSPEAVAVLLERGLDAEGATADPEALDPPGRPGRRRRPPRPDQPRGGGGPRPRAERAAGRDPGRCRGRTGHQGAPLRPGRPLRRHQRLHQEHPGIRSRCRALLARPMLESGEDARFIARRLVILASEDVGEADPMSLLVANAAAHAVEFVGLPEAQLNLAQAVVHLATAPKSNRVTTALGRARADVREQGAGEVPNHLRDAHYQGARASATARATTTPTTTTRGGSTSSTGRPSSRVGCTTSRPRTATRPRWSRPWPPRRSRRNGTDA